VIAHRFGVTECSRLSRENTRTWVILAVLVLLPLVQAFGTNTALYTIGFNAFAAWAAVMIAVLTGIWATPIVARATLGLVLVGSLVATASINTESREAPLSTRACSRLAATSRLGSSAIRATRSCG